MLLLSVLLWALAGLLGVIILALLLPVRLEVHARKEAAWAVSARIRPLGRFGPGIDLSRTRKAQGRKPDVKARRHKKRRGWSGRVSPTAILRLVSDILSRIKLDRLHLHARFGTGDPAETGEVFGYLQTLRCATFAVPQSSIRIEPDFSHRVLTGAGDLVLSVVPMRLLGPAIRFGVSMMRRPA